jgi:hypothetical protein
LALPEGYDGGPIRVDPDHATDRQKVAGFDQGSRARPASRAMSWLRAIILIAITSCSGPAKHPTLVIAETRAYNEQTAHGEARVFMTPSPHTRLAAARAWLAIAEALSATPAGAYQAAVRGVQELGPDYAGRHVRDETTTKELFAKEDFEAGREAHAAEVMMRILGSRIKMYARKYASEVE